MTTTLYKLTRKDRSTHNGFIWPVGEWQTFPGTGGPCSPGWSHWYLSPQLALLLNPIHADFPEHDLLLWRGEGHIGLRDHGLKVMCAKARIIEAMTFPQPSTEQRVKFALACALAVYAEPTFVRWANQWLAGIDRTARAAWAAKAAGAAEARAAQAAWAAAAARGAARAAARGAWAAWAARAAARAAWAAAEAADLQPLAHQALLPWEP